MLKIINDQEEAPWYRNGLSFKCTGCGKCCTGSPGYVYLSEEEVKNISTFLNLSPIEFAKKFLRIVNGRLCLIEIPRPTQPKTYDCIFLKDNKCEIYPFRPTQCRTFPWWPQNLENMDSWKEAAKECEGISNQAPVVPFEVIREQLEIQLESQI